MTRKHHFLSPTNKLANDIFIMTQKTNELKSFSAHNSLMIHERFISEERTALEVTFAPSCIAVSCEKDLRNRRKRISILLLFYFFLLRFPTRSHAAINCQTAGHNYTVYRSIAKKRTRCSMYQCNNP